jgi:hypothetical protein
MGAIKDAMVYRANRYAALMLAASTALAGKPVCAQSTNSQVRADIVASLSLVRTADLNFGNISPSALPGLVTVSPAGVRTATGGSVLAGGTVSAAEFAGLGRRNQHVTISFGSPVITLMRTGGTQTMLVTGFTHGASSATGLAAAGPWRRISDPTGIFTIPVGATLAVGSNQAAGVYRGSFNVTVNYQ